MSEQLKSILKFLVFLGLGLGLLALAFINLDLDYDKVVNGFRSANYYWIGLALVASIISNLLRAMRWNLMLEPLGKKPSAIHSFNAVMIGYLFNFAIPRLGEVSRCGILNRTDKIPLNQSLGTVVVERVFDMIILLALTVLVLILQFDLLFGFFYDTLFQPLQSKIANANITVLFLLLIIIAAGVFVFIKKLPKLKESKLFMKVNSLMQGFLEGFKSVFRLKNPGTFFLQTFLIWVLYYLNTFCYLMALTETANVGYMAALSILVMGTFGFAAPVSGGIGAYHIFVAKALALYGISSVGGGIFGFVSHGMQMIMILAVGSFSLLYTIVKEQKAFVA